MGSNGKRDAVGQQIDAAAEVMDRVEAEARRLGVTDGHLLHMVLMTWIDRHADDGLMRRSDPRVDVICRAMAEMQGEAEFLRDYSEARRG